jgi:hypothetical protein
MSMRTPVRSYIMLVRCWCGICVYFVCVGGVFVGVCVVWILTGDEFGFYTTIYFALTNDRCSIRNTGICWYTPMGVGVVVV